MWQTMKMTCSLNPSLWRLAWRIGGDVVSHVENSLTVTVTGSNIQSPVTVDYYIEARKPDGTVLGKTLDIQGASCSVGGSISNSTGQVSIDSHLSDLGLATNQDQTVDYYVYVKVTATGLISGEQLVAEVGPVKFDSVTYDYGTSNWVTMGWPDKTGSTVGVEGRIWLCRSTRDTSNDNNATAKSISVYLRVGSGYSGKVKCALYEYVALNDAGELIASTEEKTITGPYTGWVTFNFTDSQPEVELDKFYYLAVWAEDDGDGTQEIKIDYAGTATQRVCRVTASYGEWPSPLTGEVGYDRTNRIYLTAVYHDWTASWSWYPLPLSVVSLPIGRQLLWGVVIGLTCFAAMVKLLRRRGR